VSTRRVQEDQGDAASAAAVRTLAKQVQELAAGVAALTAKTSTTEQTAIQAAKAVTTISEAVQGLYGRLDQGGDADDGGGGRPSPPWWMVDDAEQARALLVDLVEWVTDVYVRYLRGTELPGCWPFHGDAVAELVALRDGWQAAYHGKHASPAAVLDWHDRWRPGTAKRVDAIMRGCSLTQHQAGKAWEPPDQPGGEVVDDVAQWWATMQGATAPPRPSADAVAAEQGRRTARDQARY
jgi:hypothetical protein